MRLNSDQLRERIEPLFLENFSQLQRVRRSSLHLAKRRTDARSARWISRYRKREQPWNDDTIVLVWSATKGIGSACLLHALQENKIKIERRVSEFWPEFGQNGKMDITLAQLLSHSAGICALDQNAEVTDYPCRYSGTGKASAALATRQRARLSRANLRIPDRRTHPSELVEFQFPNIGEQFLLSRFRSISGSVCLKN